MKKIIAGIIEGIAIILGDLLEYWPAGK